MKKIQGTLSRESVAAEDTQEKLNSGKILNKSRKQGTQLSSERRNRATRAVSGITESEAFKKFSMKRLNEIKKYDVCEVLHGTLDTREDALRLNLKTLQQYASDIGNVSEYKILSSSALKFFEFIEKNWERIMNE